MFIVNYVLYVLNESWCKLPEDGNNNQNMQELSNNRNTQVVILCIFWCYQSFKHTRVIQKLKTQNRWEGKGNDCCEGGNTVVSPAHLTAVMAHVFSNMFVCCVSLQWTCQFQIPPTLKCILLFDFSM